MSKINRLRITPCSAPLLARLRSRSRRSYRTDWALRIVLFAAVSLLLGAAGQCGPGSEYQGSRVTMARPELRAARRAARAARKSPPVRLTCERTVAQYDTPPDDWPAGVTPPTLPTYCTRSIP